MLFICLINLITLKITGMKSFMKFWNMDKTEMTILILFIMGLMMTSCSTSSYTYKGCDGKKKFKSQMSLR